MYSRKKDSVDRPGFEYLEPRLLLNSAPVALADAYSVNEDETLELRAIVHIDADGFADEEVISNAFPGVTLLAEETPGTNFLLSDDVLAKENSLASTGTNVFGHTEHDEAERDVWGDGYHNWLRAEFAGGATRVSLDFIADDTDDRNPVLRAFDSTGSQVDRATVDGKYTTGDIVTLTVEAPNIAYVQAEPDLEGLWYAWLLDNLVYEAGSGGGVLDNDSDADGDTLTAELVAGPTHAASFVLYSNGTFTYTPQAGFSGTDTFTYKASDGQDTSNEATVTITVNNLVDLSGRLFDDRDNDGVFDPDDGDVGIEGATLNLINQTTDELIDTQTTDEQGGYIFDVNLGAGTYKIVETQPAGYLDGKETAGNLGGTVDDSQDFNEITDIIAGEPGTKDDGVGYDFAELLPASLRGLVWVDFNDDGEVDHGELAIENTQIWMTGTDDRGGAVDVLQVTNAQGIFEFVDLRPGVYEITETQPADFIDGQDVLGEVIEAEPPTPPVVLGDDGYVDSIGDKFSGISLVAGSSGVNYNFGEVGEQVHAGQTAMVGFWQNKHGQDLIMSLNGGPGSTLLGHWLAETFPNMYGLLAGMTNVKVAEVFKQLFKRNGKTSPGGPPKLDAKVMGLALSTYVTKESLVSVNYQTEQPDPSLVVEAESYGFEVTAGGVGSTYFNIGDSSEAFYDYSDGQDVQIIDLLLATDSMSLNGLLYDYRGADGSDSGDGQIDDYETYLRTLAHDVYSAICEQGAI